MTAETAEQRFVCMVCGTNTVTPTSAVKTPICDECFVDDVPTSLAQAHAGDTTP